MSCDPNTKGSCRVCPGTWIVLALALAAVVYSLLPRSAGTTPLKDASQRVAVQSLSMPDLDGKIWKLDDQRGKVVLVNFWATWCPPCREETPDLVRLAKEYAGKEVSFVGIALDQGGDEQVRRFVKDQGIPYPILIPQDESPLLSTVDTIPVTLLIDRQGRIARRYEGAVTRDELKTDLERLLPEA